MVTQTLPPARPAAADIDDAKPPVAVEPIAAVHLVDTDEAGDYAYWLDDDRTDLPITLDLRPLLGGKTLAEIDFDRIFAFIDANDLYAIEYNETGELIIMPPTLMPAGHLESRLLSATAIWESANGGIAVSSATIFRIPGLGGRAPDASWVSPERLADLDNEQYRTGQVCPDFVAEIRSPSNTLAYLQRKMEQYIAAGARLGWLIDPRNRRVTIYRPGQEPELLDNPAILYGEAVMPGFEFRVGALIFDAA